ncbi:protein SMAX1-like [Zingiber officinale]|uniref:Clp R domain-containing protein n=1 Tax=Zingiber officinale TaxID=94328 RepID=A0A8J5CF06_ZINOF|nr:protein SMAX1-like [Zingiber officinale]KAG6474656.1 hypothetical protein ZIOFF_068594 [Zingiber officinale]
MKAGLSTIQQTLTPEAAAVLTQSIGEAARRSHGQATPLHVAAMLLAAPGGLLRQACARSHNLEAPSSHPLRCRALELCFSVALDRLPASAAAAAEPSISNALMAALKRAQANQRRGCPQHQPPLLAVKVNLEQLVMSILDDPSISRVMREASFSSTAVKAAIEQSLPSSSSAAIAAAVSRNVYLNPRLHYPHGGGGVGGGSSGADRPREDEVKRVLDILSRPTKRNPILVGDCDLDATLQQVLQRIRSLDAPSPLRNAQILPFAKEIASISAADHSLLPTKIRELGSSIESSISSGDRAVILDLGDLKWLAESPSGAGKPSLSETSRATVQEMASLWKHFQGNSRMWLVGAASSATYLRCQVYYPTLENDLDLQPVPIAPRFGGNNIHGNNVESLAASKALVGIGASGVLQRQPPSITDLSSRRTTLCPTCTGSYERELSILMAKGLEKDSAKPEDSRGLPQWLRIASSSPLQSEEEGLIRKRRSEELRSRWSETCSRLHHEYCRSSPTLSNPSSVLNPHRPPQLNLTLSQTGDAIAAKQPTNHPDSSVKADLVLGSPGVSTSSVAKTHQERLKDSIGCTQDMFAGHRSAKVGGISDIDMFKRLFSGLTEKVSWQQEAASAVASVVMQCKSGNGKRRGRATKGDIWLLLAGPDKIGKKKMATALSELMFGTGPMVVNFGHSPSTFGDVEESNLSLRGRTSMDRIAEEARRNPFSMIVLENIDQADMLAQGKIKKAIERGHLVDSYGREVSLGSIVFVLTSDWLPEGLKSSYSSLIEYEKTIVDSARGGFELELTIGNKTGKRHPTSICYDDRPIKLRKDSSVSTSLSLDLNLSVGEHEFDKGRLTVSHSTSSLASDLTQLVDGVVMFKPVHFAQLQRDVVESVSMKFTTTVGEGIAIRIDDEALDKITGGLWLSGATLDDWAERVLVPSLNQLRDNLKHEPGPRLIRLSATKRDQTRSNAKEWLPTTVAIAIDRDHDS